MEGGLTRFCGNAVTVKHGDSALRMISILVASSSLQFSVSKSKSMYIVQLIDRNENAETERISEHRAQINPSIIKQKRKKEYPTATMVVRVLTRAGWRNIEEAGNPRKHYSKWKTRMERVSC